MTIWKYGVFPTVLILYSFILIIIATLKIRRYQRRYNDYYAKDMNLPFFNMRDFNIIILIFVPLAGFIYYAAYMRPPYYKYWLIVGVVLLAVVQYITGRLAYGMKYDARYLAEYILLGRWKDQGVSLGVSFAVLGCIVVAALALQLIFLRPKTDNME